MRENMTPHSFPYLEILNNLDIGIALFDAEGNYLFVKYGTCKLAEYSYAGILENECA